MVLWTAFNSHKTTITVSNKKTQSGNMWIKLNNHHSQDSNWLHDYGTSRYFSKSSANTQLSSMICTIWECSLIRKIQSTVQCTPVPAIIATPNSVLVFFLRSSCECMLHSHTATTYHSTKFVQIYSNGICKSFNNPTTRHTHTQWTWISWMPTEFLPLLVPKKENLWGMGIIVSDFYSATLS